VDAPCSLYNIYADNLEGALITRSRPSSRKLKIEERPIGYNKKIDATQAANIELSPV